MAHDPRSAAALRYRVLVGLNYPPSHGRTLDRRAEPGELVDDLPEASVSWLAEMGYIEQYTASDQAQRPESDSEPRSPGRRGQEKGGKPR